VVVGLPVLGCEPEAGGGVGDFALVGVGDFLGWVVGEVVEEGVFPGASGGLAAEVEVGLGVVEVPGVVGVVGEEFGLVGHGF